MAKKMTKKKITDMVAYATLLVHNNDIESVLSAEESDSMMKMLKDTFDGDEKKALKFIRDKVVKLKADMLHDLS